MQKVKIISVKEPRRRGGDEAIGTDFGQDAFAVSDALLAQDECIAELRGEWTIQS